MSPARSAFRAAAVLTAALLLTGCVSLLPKSKPALLYRFGPAEPAAAEAPPAAAAPARDRIVGLGRIVFDSAADTDRILTVDGQSAAYIAGARWVSPAPVLFREALARTFQATPGAPRLAGGGAGLRAPALLSLEVEAFEARYDQGAGAPPLVVVRVHAALTGNQDHALLGERLISAQVRASANRQGAIAEAFQAAVQDVLGQIVAFTSRT